MSNPTSCRDRFLQAAIDEALLGLKEGGIPIGSVLVIDGEIVDDLECVEMMKEFILSRPDLWNEDNGK